MQSSLMLDNTGDVRRSVATAFLCGFCGALAGAGLSLLFDTPFSWVTASLAGAAAATALGWRHARDRAG